MGNLEVFLFCGFFENDKFDWFIFVKREYKNLFYG